MNRFFSGLERQTHGAEVEDECAGVDEAVSEQSTDAKAEPFANAGASVQTQGLAAPNTNVYYRKLKIENL